MKSSPTGYAEVNGINLYYETYGTRDRTEALVLLHGFSGTGHAHWQRQIPVFSEHYRIIVPDIRGHGRSRCHDVPYDYWELVASDVSALMAHLGLGKSHVCGFSLGSIVAQFMALNHPDVVRSLVLSGTLAHIPVTEGRGLFGFVEDLLRPDDVSPTWKKALNKMHGAEDWRLFFENYGRTVQDRLRHTEGVITRDDLDRIACPTLIVQGLRDELNPPELSEVVQQGIRGSRRVMLPGGHRVHESEAQEFNRLVLEFLDGTT